MIWVSAEGGELRKGINLYPWSERSDHLGFRLVYGLDTPKYIFCRFSRRSNSFHVRSYCDDRVRHAMEILE